MLPISLLLSLLVPVGYCLTSEVARALINLHAELRARVVLW
jgi:hypothetical protein